MIKSNSMITLFHGSPHDVKDKLKPSEPRGNDDFQRMKAVFATDKEKVAQIYAIARDKKRERKGWFVHDDKLHIRKPYTLNKKGYVYIFSTRSYLTDPENNPNQYAMTRNVIPKYKYIVRPEDIMSNIIEYESKKEYNKMADKLV